MEGLSIEEVTRRWNLPWACSNVEEYDHIEMDAPEIWALMKEAESYGCPCPGYVLVEGKYLKLDHANCPIHGMDASIELEEAGVSL